MSDIVKKFSWGYSAMIPYNETAERLGLTAYVRIENYQFIQKRAENLDIENARLKAEVERLRKAGDAMADEYRRMCKGEPAAGWFHRLMAGNEDFKIEHLDAWNAAKEGKQP